MFVLDTAQVDSNLKCFVLGFRLIILLRACDAWVSLGTLPRHSTCFRGCFQTCTEDNRLDWSIVEAISKSFSTEAKSMQLKGRGYKERLARWSNSSFTTELLQWMLTVKSKWFQGKYSTCTLIWNHFTADLLQWMLTLLFRSHDRSTFTVNGNLKLPIIKKKLLGSSPKKKQKSYNHSKISFTFPIHTVHVQTNLRQAQTLLPWLNLATSDWLLPRELPPTTSLVLVTRPEELFFLLRCCCCCLWASFCNFLSFSEVRSVPWVPLALLRMAMMSLSLGTPRPSDSSDSMVSGSDSAEDKLAAAAQIIHTTVYIYIVNHVLQTFTTKHSVYSTYTTSKASMFL